MSLDLVFEALGRVPAVQALAGDLPRRGTSTRLGGLPGSSAALLAAWLADSLPERLLVIVAPGPAEADRWLADLNQLSRAPVALYPQRESLGEDEPHYEIAGERMETVAALLGGDLRILVTTARATAERTLIPSALSSLRVTLRTGQRYPLRTMVADLDRMGYRRVASVTEVAEFSVRGGIVDVYGFGMADPARCEWWGDDISSLRQFDLTTQRSGESLPEVVILPVSAEAVLNAGEGENGPRDRRSLLELLPPDALVVEEREGVDLEEVARGWREAEHHIEVARRQGDSVPSREDMLLEPGQWWRMLGLFPRLLVREEEVDRQFGFFPPERVDRDLARLRGLLGSGKPTLILCDNEGQCERLEELLHDGPSVAGMATLTVGSLDGGFVLPTLRVLTDHEIFRRARRLRRPRRFRTAAPTSLTGTLSIGDYVVHLDHGIGIYRGLHAITLDGGPIDVAVLEYEGGDRLNVPLYGLDQIERYRAGGGGDDGDEPPPRLHRLGGTAWKKVRDRTRSGIREMAAELLELYARRTVSAGDPCPPDTRWQRELESSFLYEDTPDQRRATDEVKRDLERPHPMDRLLVGDVGYGKTEIAVRAAFKAVQSGRQVAILVPTTILAEQHGRTFTERLADFPVRVEVLSRFRSPKEQKAALARLATGETDIIIGTHRILSRDVIFKELGLLVVDEEHRFGVRHKERLKELRLRVHVLTLTATPIPRTLHMSLAGLRDLSLIETAPQDRSPVLTFVEPWDDALIEEACTRELDRGGQVFVVHNRIETIETIAARVRGLVPRARVAVAHGQMPTDRLEEVMGNFVNGTVDILVSTMIVESGLDVPNANTMIVHDAHRFGLAQLYQLRGRVGRSHRRAHCYLIAPDTVDPEAEERLKVLEHNTELGSGYRIALKDLELRGAGNLLGAEQSGHAQAVGFDLYLRWLEETVRALRSRQGDASPAPPAPPDVVFDRPARLPDDYIPDDEGKLDLYRRLARAGTIDEIGELGREIRERFGPLPAEAEHFLDMTRLRVLGAGMGLQHVLVRGDEARLTFREGTAPRLAGLTVALDDVQLSVEVRRTVPLSLRLIRLGGVDIIPALVRAVTAAAQAGARSASPRAG